MELKKYFTMLRELTITKQIQWVREGQGSNEIQRFDCRFDPLNAVSIVFIDTYQQRRVTVTITNGDNPHIILSNLDSQGETQKAIWRLWDEIICANLAKRVDDWYKVLPEINKAIKFGPKDDASIKRLKEQET